MGRRFFRLSLREQQRQQHTRRFSQLHNTLNLLYAADCGHDHAELAAGDSILSDLTKALMEAFETAMVWLHGEKKYRPSMLKQPAIKQVIAATNKVLQQAIRKNITQEMPPRMRDALQKNVFFFSGMKTHAAMSEASTLLTDDKGNLKPLAKFTEEVKSLNEDYNDKYLRAERNFAVKSSQMAGKWQKYEQGKDRYDLRYLTDNGPNVRDSHRAMEFTTLPVDDPFWDKYTPPNGYNCHCFLVQVRKGEYPVSDSEEAMNKGDAATTQIGKDGKNKAEIFRFNPGKEMKVMPPDHPYTSGNCGNLAAAWQSLSIIQKVELAGQADKCRAKKVVEEMMKVREERRSILSLPRHEQFEEIKDELNGISVLKHKLVMPKPNDPKDDYYHLIQSAAAAKKKGELLEILPTLNGEDADLIKKILPGYDVKNKFPDFRNPISNEYLDLKRPEAIKNILKLANEASMEKEATVVISDVYLKTELTDKILKNRLDDIFSSQYYKSDTIYFMKDGVLYKYNRP